MNDKEIQNYIDNIEHIKVLFAAHNSDLKVMQLMLNKLEKSLFGNGQKGIIQKHSEDISEIKSQLDKINLIELKKSIDSINKWRYIFLGMLLVTGFLTGNGVMSLKSIIEKMF